MSGLQPTMKQRLNTLDGRTDDHARQLTDLHTELGTERQLRKELQSSLGKAWAAIRRLEQLREARPAPSDLTDLTRRKDETAFGWLSRVAASEGYALKSADLWPMRRVTPVNSEITLHVIPDGSVHGYAPEDLAPGQYKVTFRRIG